MTDAFKSFSEKVQNRFYELVNNDNSVVAVADVPKEYLWDTYLENIPEEHNQIFRERREFDAVYDKQFIRRVGGIVVIIDGVRHTIWDVEEESFFGPVAEKLHNLVINAPIRGIFLSKEREAGHGPSVDSIDPSIVWDSFYVKFPEKLVHSNRWRSLNDAVNNEDTNISVLRRSILEAESSDIMSIIELIDDHNGLYRGEEFRGILSEWLNVKTEYNKAEDKEAFIVETAKNLGSFARFRSTVIGTLITDMYNGLGIGEAVRKFEDKVAPHNYKRSSAVITPKMVADAQKKLIHLGYNDSIYRRLAKPTDVSNSHKIYSSSGAINLDVFDDISDEASKNTKKIDLTKSTYIPIEKFLEKVEGARKVEIAPTSSMYANRVALTTALNEDSGNMFKWDNRFAWSYLASETTDAIRERVKNAGGNVDGDIRVSLAWYNTDDLDLHAYKDGKEVYYGNRRGFGATLDVDMNVSGESTEPVENIFWEKMSSFPKNGKVKFKVHQFTCRNSADVGFELQVYIDGATTTFKYDQKVTGYNDVIELKHTKSGVEISWVSDNLTKVSETSNVSQFVDVDSIMLSPNHWDGNSVGNKHYIFATKDFEIEKPVRGFFNEYLNEELKSNRKVFEILGNKTKITDGFQNALRGYGFSSTIPAQIISRVTLADGSVRLYNVNI